MTGDVGDDYEEEYDQDHEDFKVRYMDRKFFRDSLEGDVDACENALAANPTHPFLLRTFVRTVFAQIEGLCAEVIDWARYYAADESVHREMYTPAERAVLKGQVAVVGDDGVAKLQEDQKFRTSKTNIRFAIELAGRGAADPYVPNFTDGGWAALIESTKVRDRLMHPKTPEDIVVTDQELKQVRRGRDWFLETHRGRIAAEQKTAAKSLAKTFEEWRKQEKEKAAKPDES